jgi:hypothetical protein
MAGGEMSNERGFSVKKAGFPGKKTCFPGAFVDHKGNRLAFALLM